MIELLHYFKLVEIKSLFIFELLMKLGEIMS